MVITSMTTSSTEAAPRGLEFLFSLNRLNVATSRARCACILSGQPGVVRGRMQDVSTDEAGECAVPLHNAAYYRSRSRFSISGGERVAPTRAPVRVVVGLRAADSRARVHGPLTDRFCGQLRRARPLPSWSVKLSPTTPSEILPAAHHDSAPTAPAL